MRGRSVAVWCTALCTLLSVVLIPVAAHAVGGTTYSWIGSSNSSGGDNHSWSDAHNWSPMGVPADGDSVVIAQPSQSDCAAHVDGVPTVTLTDFSLAQVPTLCTTSITGGDITVSGQFSWDGGELDTPTTIGSDATGTVAGANQELSSLAAELDVDGTLALSGATGDGALQLVAGQTVHIESDGTLSSSGTEEIDGSACCVTPAVVVNDGVIEVDSGTLTIMNAGLQQHAEVSVLPAAQLISHGGVVTTQSGVYSGGGSWLLTEGVQAHFTGTTTLSAGSVLELGGLTSTASSVLTGTLDLTGHGTFAWTGGVLAAKTTIGPAVAMTVDGVHTGNARRVLSGHDLSTGGSGTPVSQTNHGVIELRNGATVSTSSQAHLVNAADGTLEMEPGTSFSSQACCASPDRIVNAGTVRVLATADPTPATLDGVSYQTTGTTSIAAKHTLSLIDEAPDVFGAASFTGGGTLAVNTPSAVSGTVRLAGTTRLALGDHGSLDGDATLGGSGSLLWTGGALSGDVTLAQGGGTAVSGPSDKVIANVGGGSTPSKVITTAPMTIAAGTSKAHDVIDIGSSRLLLEAATSAGAFTEFTNGLLDNHDELKVHGGKVFARAFRQRSAGVLSLDFARSAHGVLQVLEGASMHGTVRVHNTTTPAAGTTIAALTAGSMKGSVSCVATSGAGAGRGHWTAAVSTTKVELSWKRGQGPHC